MQPCRRFTLAILCFISCVLHAADGDGKRADAAEFVARSGAIVQSVPLPNSAMAFSYRRSLVWSPADARIIFSTYSKTTQEYTVQMLTVATGKVAAIATTRKAPTDVAWLGENIVAVSAARTDENGSPAAPGELMLIHPDAEGERVRRIEFETSVVSTLKSSPDGKHLAFLKVERADQTSSIMLLSVAGGEPVGIRPDIKIANPTATPQATLVEWLSATSLKINAGWQVGEQSAFNHPKLDPYIYDAATKTFAKAEPARELQQLNGAIRDSVGGTPLWALPGKRVFRHVLAAGQKEAVSTEPPRAVAAAPAIDPKAAPVDPRGIRPDSVKASIADGYEILGENDKVLASVKINCNGGDLWPRCISADGRYLLASTFQEYKYHVGAPHSAWEPVATAYILIDLEKGTRLEKFSFENVTWPRASCVAVMPGTREVVVIDTNAIDYGANAANPNHGVWALGFDGGKKRVEHTAFDPINWAGEDESLSASPYRTGIGAIGLMTRPEAYFKAPGTHYLVAFVNGAVPVTVYATDKAESPPRDLSWSSKGRLLAFIADDKVHVWQASADAPKEEPAKAKANTDF